ncbi:MAG: hypothetical protein ACAI25_01480 [Planctomycetota bacterium]
MSESRRTEIQRRQVAAYARLLDAKCLEAAPDTIKVGAFYSPAFHQPCAIEVTLPRDGAGTVRVATFGTISNFLIDSLGPEPPRVTPAFTLDARRRVTTDNVERLRDRLREIDPWSLENHPAMGLDGIDCYGRVVGSARTPRDFLAFMPWQAGARRHAEFFDLVLEVALAEIREPETQIVLKGVERYRRT